MMSYIYETGDTVYYPKLDDAGGREMQIKGVRIHRYTSGRIWADYIIEGHTEEGKGLTDRLVEDLKSNTDNAYDNLVIVCGNEGTGKSNFAIDLCRKFDPSFNLRERYIYDYLPFLQSLERDFDSKTTGKAYLMDEATNLANNRDWNQEDNKNFMQLLEMFRSKGLTLVMCIPSFDRLDKYIREYRARFKIETLDLPKGERFEGRGFYKLTICRNNQFVAMGTFPEMSPEDKEIYEKLKEESQRKKLEEMINAAEKDPKGKKKKDLELKKMMVRDLHQMGVGLKEMSKKYDIPLSTLYRWLDELGEE